MDSLFEALKRDVLLKYRDRRKSPENAWSDCLTWDSEKLEQFLSSIETNFQSSLPTSPDSLLDYLGRSSISKRKSLKPFFTKDRRKYISYILSSLSNATLNPKFLELTGKGLNLAHFPFVAPATQPTTNCPASHVFAEQYRWDTYFQNFMLNMFGLYNLSIGQLLNLSAIYQLFRIVPNATTSSFLSHSQPPLDAYAAFELVDSIGGEPGPWFHYVMQTIEQELFEFWWDYPGFESNSNNSKINPRQTDETQFLGDLLTRHTSVHYSPLLVGCEDGKDHNWVNAHYGEHYIPVQLNTIIWGNLGLLCRYYREYTHNLSLANQFDALQKKLGEQINQLMWVPNGRYRGFRNFSLLKRKNDTYEGPIKYGDLAAEIWPLFTGLATEEQALLTLSNLKNHYQTDIGLSATSYALRKGGSIKKAPEGWKCQWELNVWPPLMMVAFKGLKNYTCSKYPEFGIFLNDLAENWITWLEEVFEREHTFYEKSPSSRRTSSNDQGFYGNLPRFGWTMASYLMALEILNMD